MCRLSLIDHVRNVWRMANTTMLSCPWASGCSPSGGFIVVLTAGKCSRLHQYATVCEVYTVKL